MKGYILNTLTVIFGSLIGFYFGKKINERVKENIFNALGLITIFLGIKMTLMGKNMITIVLSIVIGTFTGSILNLEDNVSAILEKLKIFLGKKGRTDGFLI